MLCCVAALLLVCAAPIQSADIEYARDCVEVGWVDRFETDEGWRCEPWLVRAAEEHARSEFGAGGGSFQVPTVDRAMAWTRTTNPVWTSDFPWLDVEYVTDGAAGDARTSILLSDDSTGPITPGALNPENPLASGGQTQIDLPAPGGRLVVDLRGRFKSDRAARFTLLVQSHNKPARLTIRRLAFRATDPRSGPQPPSTASTSARLLSPGGKPSATAASDWQSIPLPADRTIPAEWLARAFGTLSSWPSGKIIQRGIPFELGPADAAARATGVMEIAALEIPVRCRGSELAMLLAVRVFGSTSPWLGTAPPRKRIASPHELVVHLRYEDGTERSWFPWSVIRRDWPVERLPQAYVVPLDSEKTLISFCVEDKMDFGQIFLLGAAVNPSARTVFAPPPSKPVGTPPNRPLPVSAATRALRENDVLTIQNAWVRLTADVSVGFNLRELTILPLDRSVVVSSTGPASLAEVHDGAGHAVPLKLRDLGSSREAAATVVEISWLAGDSAELREVRLRLEAADNGELRLIPGLTNSADIPWEPTFVCPRLVGCRISERPDDRWYLLGTRSTILDARPLTLEQSYGGAFPLQLIDLFAPQTGGGIGLLVQDLGFVPKTFRFRQDADAATVSVSFPQVRVPPKGQVTLPPVLLFCHLGDWHQAFERYRHEARSQAQEPAGRRMRNLFYCRRDYPLGGTGYLFNPVARSYTPEMLIEESTRGFAGIDMIDISGWAYHEATGRVGDYRTNDLGGLAELRRAVDAAHRQKVSVGLYFEGYLIDRRVDLAAKALPAWQIVDSKGQPAWWSGKMEFFTCPGVAQWREELSAAMADVAAETGADAVYVDEFGFSDARKACWSPDHGHPVPSNPLIEEQRMLAGIRRALDRRSPNVAIYIEQIPCDAMMPLIDGAFNYGMAGTGLPQHATCLPLHRYVFPEVASIEMVGYGIRPLPVAEDNLHRCLFHGLAVWLKGRSDSWYSPGFRDLARRARHILHDYADVFRSSDCEPLIPTLVDQIYANRFVTPSAVILTVYNAQFTNISGDLLRTSIPADWHARDLLRGRPADIRRDGDKIILRAPIPARSVAVFLISRQSVPSRVR